MYPYVRNRSKCRFITRGNKVNPDKKKKTSYKRNDTSYITC